MHRIRLFLSFILLLLFFLFLPLIAFSIQAGKYSAHDEAYSISKTDLGIENTAGHTRGDPFVVSVKTTSTGYLNVRTGPGPSYEIITQIYPGQKFISHLYENGWYRIHLPSGAGNAYGWCYGGTTTDNGYLEGSQETSYVQVVDWKGDLYVRTGPGTSYSIITTISSGQRFAAIEESNGWHKIYLANIEGYSYGWSSGNYLHFFPGGNRDGFQAELSGIEFPSSMETGNVSVVNMDILNKGSNSFNTNTILATTNPRFRPSPFYHSTWQSDSRIMGASGNCLPGQIIRYSFYIKAPDVKSGTAYTEYFNLYQDNYAWFSDQGGPDDTSISFTLTVAGSSDSAPKREFRAVWISTVYNIDWPKEKGAFEKERHIEKEYLKADWPDPGKDTAGQQASLLAILDEHKAIGINAVFLQVRPACDAFYQSSLEPWSRYLTGTEGQAPNPFWDPLEFAIEACHERGMELHAWINPYRARAGGTTNHPTHVINTHPEWIVTYGASDKKVLNPGLPEVRNHVASVINDIVSRYDVDGIHFDDYFYAYPESGYTFNDTEAYNTYGGGMSLSDWRRSNVNTLVEMVHDTVKSVNPRIKFGISPFGIWRSGTPPGIYGLSAYDDIYCDALAWLEGSYVDYIAPQLYWGYGGSTDYALLMPWWALQAGSRHFTPGLAAYRVANGQLAPETLKQQVIDSRHNGSCQGHFFFSSRSLADYSIVNNLLKNELYQTPALVPVMSWLDDVSPEKPVFLEITESQTGTLLVWGSPEAASDGEYPSRYVVYYSSEPDINFSDAGNILYITGISDEPELSYNHQTESTYYYAVTSLDRIGNESLPTYGSSVNDPAEFNALAQSPYQINLSWTKNNDQDDVMVAFNTSDSFGVPYGIYEPGQAITGGGTVLFRGFGTNYDHAGLMPGTVYYYKIWSYNSHNQYSQGITVSAETQGINSYFVTLYVYPDTGSAELTGSGIYAQGEQVQINVLNQEYTYFRWVGDPDDIILLSDPESPSSSFSMPDRNIIFTAVFIEDTLLGKAVISLSNPAYIGTYIWSYSSDKPAGLDTKASDWQIISGVSSSGLLTGDILGNSSLQIISCFPGYGLWYYRISDNIWVNIMGSSVSCTSIALVNTGAAQQLVASFEGYGLYLRSVHGQWSRLTVAEADKMIAFNSNRDADNIDELIFTAPCCSGLYLYDFQLKSFLRLQISTPSRMLSADITGDGFEELICVFDSAGIFIGHLGPNRKTGGDMEERYKLYPDIFYEFKSNKAAEWERITSAVPMEGHFPGSANIAGSPGKEIFMSYNNKTYYYSYENSAWFTFLNAPLDRIISGKFCNGHYDDIIAQASSDGSIYIYKKQTNSWEIMALSGNSSEMIPY